MEHQYEHEQELHIRLDSAINTRRDNGEVRVVRVRSDVYNELKAGMIGTAGHEERNDGRTVVARYRNLPVVLDDTLRDPGFTVD